MPGVHLFVFCVSLINALTILVLVLPRPVYPQLNLPCSLKRKSRTSYDRTVFHYSSYVPLNGRLMELDGLKVWPVDHGIFLFFWLYSVLSTYLLWKVQWRKGIAGSLRSRVRFQSELKSSLGMWLLCWWVLRNLMSVFGLSGVQLSEVNSVQSVGCETKEADIYRNETAEASRWVVCLCYIRYEYTRTAIGWHRYILLLL